MIRRSILFYLHSLCCNSPSVWPLWMAPWPSNWTLNHWSFLRVHYFGASEFCSQTCNAWVRNGAEVRHRWSDSGLPGEGLAFGLHPRRLRWYQRRSPNHCLPRRRRTRVGLTRIERRYLNDGLLSWWNRCSNRRPRATPPREHHDPSRVADVEDLSIPRSGDHGSPLRTGEHEIGP